MDILGFFPEGVKPRPVQVHTLKKLQEVWDKADVFVINLPVAAGKSNIAYTIAQWQAHQFRKRASIITPTNILVDQYIKDFPRLHSVQKMSNYKCTLYKGQKQVQNCDDSSRMRGKAGKRNFCGDCPYRKSLIKSKKEPVVLYNYYTYMVHKAFTPILIVDEAHNLLPMIQDMASKQLWQHEYLYPNNINTHGQLYKWAKEALEKNPNNPKLNVLYSELISNKNRYLINRTVGLWMKEERDVIKLLPIDVRDQPPFLWPEKHTQKVVLLSATIGRKDIELMGLDKKKVMFLSATSPIPKENRPLFTSPSYGLSLSEVDANYPKVADAILKIIDEHPGQKGFIHATYGLADKLLTLLKDNPRIMWHTKENKMEVYNRFRSSPAHEGAVMLSSGLYEGVDLAGDIGRFQILTKVPWPNLAEPAVAHMARMDQHWYANETIKLVAQAYGRICRSPTDFGKTFILDSSFARLYSDFKELFPDWLSEVIDGV